MKTAEEFKVQFGFDSTRNLFVGIEREAYLLDLDPPGKIMPLAVKVLDYLGSQNGHFGYELSACQLEWRVGPCSLSRLKNRLIKDERILTNAERKLGFKRSLVELPCTEDFPLDVYPDPTGRYQVIKKKLSREVLAAACRAISTHIHIGMPSHKTALRVYNKVIRYFDELCELSGRCLDNYKIVVPKHEPPCYSSWKNFYETAIKQKFVDNPRDCWYLIRISVHGSIEFRMFGATENIDRIVTWAKFCHKICQEAQK